MKEKNTQTLITFAVHADDLERAGELIPRLRDGLRESGCAGELIVIDAICEPASREWMRQWERSERLLLLENETALQGESFRMAAERAEGRYLMCLTAEQDFAPEKLTAALLHLAELAKTAGEGEEPLIALRPVYAAKDGKQKKYLGAKREFRGSEPLYISLEESPDAFSLYPWGYFYPTAGLRRASFSEELPEDALMQVLVELLCGAKAYWLLPETILTHEPTPNCWFEYPAQFSKTWYLNSMEHFLARALDEHSPLCAQYMILYLIQLRYSCNLNERDKSILQGEEKRRFFELTRTALRHVSDEVIARWNIAGMKISEQSLTMFYFRMKYNDPCLFPELVYREEDHNLLGNMNGAPVGDINQKHLLVQVIYYDGANLTIDARFTGSYLFDPDKIYFVAKVNGANYRARTNRVYSLIKAFNETIGRDFTFQSVLPSESFSQDVNSMGFYLVYEGREYPIPSLFSRPQSKLNRAFSATYYAFDKKMLQYDVAKDVYVVTKATRFRVFVNECKLMWQFIKKKKKHKYGLLCAGMRAAYWLTKPFYEHKRIWLTQDKLFKAGDNGEYFFRYVMQNKRGDNGVKLYYVVNEDSPDYPRLKKQYPHNVLRFNSLRHRLTALHADMILATHVDTLHCNGFTKQAQLYFKDLFNGRVACLAHGLTIQKIAQYQNRTFDNTVLYFFASKYEVENVKHEIYDYYDPSMLKLTGHGRYDGLINRDKRQLLITPTWRRSFTTGAAKKGSTYGHSETFKSSDYFKIYNGLINDERLIAAAKKYGYRIMYLLHPAMSSQLEDFDKNDYVDIVAATSAVSYEQVLTESSLMVTDYSGVQFDFAYMKKPVVYYHPSILPPQYESSGLDYETMGFGPICTGHEQIVETLCRYMEKDCVLEKEYCRRVDDFYAFSDHNNAARIYEEVIRFQERYPKVNDIF